MLYFTIYAGLLNTNFLTHFVIRAITFAASVTIEVHWRINNLESTIGGILLTNLAGFVLVEVIFFVQYKVRAKLFLSGR